MAGDFDMSDSDYEEDRPVEPVAFKCDECGAFLSERDVEEGQCTECGGHHTSVPVFGPPEV